MNAPFRIPSPTSPEVAELVARAQKMRAEYVAQHLRALGAAVMRAFAAIVTRIEAYRLRHETYRELMALDDRVLADIGLNRAELDQLVKNLAAGQATAANVNRPSAVA